MKVEKYYLKDTSGYNFAFGFNYKDVYLLKKNDGYSIFLKSNNKQVTLSSLGENNGLDKVWHFFDKSIIQPKKWYQFWKKQ